MLYIWNVTGGSLGPGAGQSRSPWAEKALVYVVVVVVVGCSVYEREYTGKKQDGQQSPVVKEDSHSILCENQDTSLCHSVPFFRDSRLGFFLRWDCVVLAGLKLVTVSWLALSNARI